MEKENKIKNLIIILAIVLLCAVSFTISFFTNRGQFTKEYNPKEYNVTLEETFNNTWGEKKVYINNQGTADTYLRISYNEVWYKQIENTILYQNNLEEDFVVTKNWTESFLNDFTLIDGWYYYNKVLEGNTKLQILESIEKKKETDTNIEGYEYELSFNFETIQATEKALQNLWDKKADINNGVIIWS